MYERPDEDYDCRYVVMMLGIFMFGFTVIGLFLIYLDKPMTVEIAGLIMLCSAIESAAVAGWYELSMLIKKWRGTHKEDRGY